MSDAFFEKLFGDSEPGDFGTGWISGTASVFFGLLGFGGALCLHFPGLLSLARRARYLSDDDHSGADSGDHRPRHRARRHLGTPQGAQGSGRYRRVARVAGGDHRWRQHAAAGRSPIEIRSRSGLVSAGSIRDDRGLSAGGTILAAASGSEDVSASVDHGLVLLRGHASACPADNAGDGRAGRLCVQVAGDSVAGQHRRKPAVSHPTAAGDCRRRSLAIRHASRLSPHSIPVALSCDPSLH